MLNKRTFYVDKQGSKIYPAFKYPTPRNLYILWNLTHVGVPDDMPDGFWIVTLERRRRVVLPGLVFREA